MADSESTSIRVVTDFTAPNSASTRRILIPIDFSHDSAHALSWAVDNIVDKTRDTVVLLHVFSYTATLYSTGMYTEFGAELGSNVQQIATQQMEIALGQLREQAQRLVHSQVSVKAVSVEGDPREEIPRLVQSMQCSMVVMGSRGLGRLKRLLLGSVSSHVVHHANVPVVVVPCEE